MYIVYYIGTIQWIVQSCGIDGIVCNDIQVYYYVGLLFFV